MDKTLIALLPFFGVVTGAFLQYIFTNLRERQSQKKQLKIKAYADYALAAAELSSRDKNMHAMARVKLTDAKVRIAIYGSEQVVKYIADFDRNGANLANFEGKKRFIKIIKTMRAENKKDNVTHEDFAQVLFSSDLT
ncbi:hypothetical protein GCM10009122_42200 [Fulvivirga kasyanovii]|uniref:Uncharacterized protein n=1 Tax=Fulvivirga kasyanovii TaxID=396812 RepID=A0ABW9RI52_9BACT|nr:hypothetical protein [Fulvivirga kasyanovii]MTI23744.1 hypothetical protein [Fulvivirga kasyanovii]